MPQMTQTLVSVVFFVVLLALVPVALKWVQRRSVGGASGVASASRIISAIAVGPHQRVVTVEVGPEGGRVWLTLGVTAQTVTCLHTAAIDTKTDALQAQASQVAPALT